MKKYLVGTLLCIISLFFSCEEPNEPKEEPNKIYTIEIWEMPYQDNLEFDEIHIIEYDKNEKRLCKNRVEKMSLGESKTFVAKKDAKELKIYFHSAQLDAFLYQQEFLHKGTNKIKLCGVVISDEEYFDAILLH